jgi:hypothetical protein
MLFAIIFTAFDANKMIFSKERWMPNLRQQTCFFFFFQSSSASQSEAFLFLGLI